MVRCWWRADGSAFAPTVGLVEKSAPLPRCEVDELGRAVSLATGDAPRQRKVVRMNSISQSPIAPLRAVPVQERLREIRRRKIGESISRIEMWRGLLTEALASGSDIELQSAARIVLEDCFELGKTMAGVAR